MYRMVSEILWMEQGFESFFRLAGFLAKLENFQFVLSLGSLEAPYTSCMSSPKTYWCSEDPGRSRECTSHPVCYPGPGRIDRPSPPHSSLSSSRHSGDCYSSVMNEKHNLWYDIDCSFAKTIVTFASIPVDRQRKRKLDYYFGRNEIFTGVCLLRCGFLFFHVSMAIFSKYFSIKNLSLFSVRCSFRASISNIL